LTYTNYENFFGIRLAAHSNKSRNYMGIKESFKITNDMVQDEKYFDKLFSQWYENQKVKNAVKN